MFLAIDVGNTQSTLGLFDDEGQLAKGWRMTSTRACSRTSSRTATSWQTSLPRRWPAWCPR